MLSGLTTASSFSQVFPNFLPSFKSWGKLGDFTQNLGKSWGFQITLKSPQKPQNRAFFYKQPTCTFSFPTFNPQFYFVYAKIFLSDLQKIFFTIPLYPSSFLSTLTLFPNSIITTILNPYSIPISPKKFIFLSPHISPIQHNPSILPSMPFQCHQSPLYPLFSAYLPVLPIIPLTP